MSETLVIGYGNPLRRDDGVGPEVVRRLGDRPGVKAVEAHQLLPEHIEAAATADHVILVDAAVDLPPGEIRCDEVVASGDRSRTMDLHELSPLGLVAAAAAVYGRSPPTWLVRIGVEDVALGEGLSPAVAAAVDAAVECVVRLL